MNMVQKAFVEARDAMEAAKAKEDWVLADKLCDAYLENENNLVKWFLDKVESFATYSKSEIDLIRKNWYMMPAKIDEMVKLALNLEGTV